MSKHIDPNPGTLCNQPVKAIDADGNPITLDPSQGELRRWLGNGRFPDCSRLFLFNGQWYDWRLLPDGDVLIDMLIEIGASTARGWFEESQLPLPLVLADNPAPEAPKRKRRSFRKATPITAKQTEAMQLVGEFRGNLTAAAKAAGITRQGMANRYTKALDKLAKTKADLKPLKSKSLPHDRRGQVTVADEI